MGDKGAGGREEIYGAWYEGEQLEEWNGMKAGRKSPEYISGKLSSLIY